MNMHQDPSQPDIDALIQQLLDGELEDVDAALAHLDEQDSVRQAADLQLVHSMLLHMHDRVTGKNEQRLLAAIQRLSTEPASVAERAVVGRIGRFVTSPLIRWAAAACFVLAVILIVSNTGTTAVATVDRLIEAATADADRTYLITHDLGGGPPPAPFGQFNGDPSQLQSRHPDGGRPDGNGPPPHWGKDRDDEKWKKMREHWEAKRRKAEAERKDNDRDNRENSDSRDHGRRDDKRHDGDRNHDDRREGDRNRDDHRGHWGDKRRHGSRDRSRDDDRRGSHGRRPPYSFGPATLYVRGSNQFVLKRPMPNGELIVGSNGKQSWFVGPDGPVYISNDPRTLCSGPQGDLALPFLNISEGLDQLKKRYDITKVADAPLPDNADDGQLWQRIDGVRRGFTFGPRQMKLWADPSTGIVKKVILDGFASRHRHSFNPQRILFDLQSTDKLPDDWFEHTAHHEPDREVKVREPRSHHKWRK